MHRLKTFLTVIGAVTILVLAANSAVYAATGGKFFLGKVNKASKASTLKRTTSGPALNLVTTSSGSAPLTSNGAGKVTNLNADLLDGKDSTAFAPYPRLVRGAWAMGTTAAAGGVSTMADISFGWTLPTAPTAHFIPEGGPVPAGCSGTPAAPDASPGHLCVFQMSHFGTLAMASAGVCSPGGLCPGADRMGAVVYGYTSAPGVAQAAGTWAVRPASVSASRLAPSTSDAVAPSAHSLGR